MKNEDSSMTDIPYEWIEIRSSRGIPFQFDREIDLPVRDLHKKPAIYRWVFLRGSIPLKVYIGQTENLQRRVRGYLNPGPSQTTNQHIHREFESAIEQRLTVRLEILRAQFRINRVVVSTDHLSDGFIRLMLENFLLADFDVANCELLNLVANPIERRKRRALNSENLVVGA